MYEASPVRKKYTLYMQASGRQLLSESLIFYILIHAHNLDLFAWLDIFHCVKMQFLLTEYESLFYLPFWLCSFIYVLFINLLVY